MQDIVSMFQSDAVYIDLYIHPLLFVLKLKGKKAGHVIGSVAGWIVAGVWMWKVALCLLPHCCGLLPSPDLPETYQNLKGRVKAQVSEN